MNDTVGHEATIVAQEANGGEALWFFGELATILLAGEQTAERFAIVEHQSPQGMSPPWHVQPDDDETFHVIDGQITFWAGDPSKPLCLARPGSVMCIPRGTPHSFRIESEQARWLSLHTPAGHERFYRAAGDPAPARTCRRPAHPTSPALKPLAPATASSSSDHPPAMSPVDDPPRDHNGPARARAVNAGRMCALSR